MPEVIEILKYADFLRTKLKHNNIIEVNVLNGRYKKHGDFKNLDDLKKALPQKVKHIDTKGKSGRRQAYRQCSLESARYFRSGQLSASRCSLVK